MDIADWLDLDLVFHTAITKAAKSKILELAMTAVHFARPTINSVFVVDRRVVTDQHEAVYLTIEAGDPAAAQAAIQRHVSYLDAVCREALEEKDAADVLVSTLSDVGHSAAELPSV